MGRCNLFQKTLRKYNLQDSKQDTRCNSQSSHFHNVVPRIAECQIIYTEKTLKNKPLPPLKLPNFSTFSHFLHRYIRGIRDILQLRLFHNFSLFFTAFLLIIYVVCFQNCIHNIFPDNKTGRSQICIFSIIPQFPAFCITSPKAPENIEYKILPTIMALICVNILRKSSQVEHILVTYLVPVDVNFFSLFYRKQMQSLCLFDVCSRPVRQEAMPKIRGSANGPKCFPPLPSHPRKTFYLIRETLSISCGENETIQKTLSS